MKKTKNDISIINCPECGKQAKVTSPIVTSLILAPACFISALILSFIPVIGWFSSVICLILGVIFLVTWPIITLFGKYVIQCKHCNSKFTLTRKEYKEYKEMKENI